MIRTSYQDLLTAIRATGVEDGSVLMVHSDLPSLGVMEGGATGVIEALLEAVGKSGTLVMPTFTFRFFNEEFNQGVPFDPQNIRSETGIISEEFRTHYPVHRTINPIHSVAAFGPKASEIVGHVSESSFGAESPFGIMTEINGINLMLGVDFQSGATFIHHVEEMEGVPYRYWKEFPGRVTDSKRTDNITYRMYVRDLNFDQDFNRIGDILDEQGLVRTVHLGYGSLRAINLVEGYRAVAELISVDSMACAVSITSADPELGWLGSES